MREREREGEAKCSNIVRPKKENKKEKRKRINVGTMSETNHINEGFLSNEL